MRLAITMGDPSGIGPEIALKALTERGCDDCLVVGDLATMRRAAEIVSCVLPLHAVTSGSAKAFKTGSLNVWQPEMDSEHHVHHKQGLLPFGKISPVAGRMAFAAIKQSVALVRGGVVDGIVTAPIHKAALAAAGVDYPGHTEALQSLTQAKSVAMMLANHHIRTVFVSTHCSLRVAIETLSIERQMTAIALAHEGASKLGVRHPRIAVAGLNPHAGENGRFGSEEIDVIGPAVTRMFAQGFDVVGPLPGDTVYMHAMQGRFDIIVAQYHDQGHIPIKLLGLDDGVNITLGLPFVRTSPDHGTAFDIAGTGKARASSMCRAIDHAAMLVSMGR